MKLIEQKYSFERNEIDSYQCFEVVQEMENSRRFIKVEIGYPQRWRSTAEYADYLRWIATEIERLPT